MTPDDAYSLLKEANPVPDPLGYLELLTEGSPVMAPHELRREEMQSIDVETKTANQSRRPSRRMVVAMAALITVLATVAIVVNRESGVASSRGDAELAIQRAQEFLSARNAADLQAAAGLDFGVPQAVMTEWEWWSAFAQAGYRGEVGGCTTTTEQPVTYVTCPLTSADPVMSALGEDEIEIQFQFFPNAGQAGWLKVPRYIDYRETGAAEAYGSYLSGYEPDVYDKSCAPAAYESQSILSSDGIAFTPECAQALIPYLDDIGAWIETGRPIP